MVGSISHKRWAYRTKKGKTFAANKRKTFKSLFRYTFEPDQFVWNEFKQAMPGPKGEPHGRGS